MKLKDKAGVWLGIASLILAAGLTAHEVRANPQRQGAAALQPFADQVREIERALDFFGQPLAAKDRRAINAAFAAADPATAVARAESVLDRYTLVEVTINPESRVDVKRGEARADLVQHGTRLFLIKIVNQAGVTAPLRVESPNSGRVYVPSTGNPSPAQQMTPEEVRERWAEISLLSKTLSPPAGGKPSPPERLSGFALEYRILMIYSRDAGERSAKLAFDVGQGTQDIGFLNELTILFKIAAARPITLRVLDADGKRTMASFIFKDSEGRIYPNPAKRLAPDFYFQPQVYRYDGEHITLPAGSYTATFTGGPEYVTETRQFSVTAAGPREVTFHLQRWIDPARYGWYSGDHHIHAAGCSHYESPSQGVGPADMDRQVEGEHLNVGCVLTWGPCYYYQKRYFTGHDSRLSKKDQLLHYDLEVSGFPSSHCGHLVLLGLKEQDYPGTKRIEDWPTWDLPILRWAKSQGATVGFAHSGWGLEVSGTSLPNYEVPGYDGIGANEYIVDATYPNTVDFISAGDTPYAWELNMWYQTLNVGFRPRISGETDFPCIYDSRVGEGRTYAKVNGPLTYSNWLDSIRRGESYVSDGRSHLMDFKMNGLEVGTGGSEVRLRSPGIVHATVMAAAYLDPQPDTDLDRRPYDQKPYWNIERARIGTARKVLVELVVNGEPVAHRKIVADGRVQQLRFDVPIRRSGWMAVRILPSSHTNPIFAVVGGKPMRPSCRSADWCLAGVNQCWTQKSPLISARELPAAKQAYDHARAFYKSLVAKCSN
ncbi:MAG: CehA/McbA family metallohydrolase [Terriglobia bacterium]